MGHQCSVVLKKNVVLTTTTTKTFPKPLFVPSHMPRTPAKCHYRPPHCRATPSGRQSKKAEKRCVKPDGRNGSKIKGYHTPKRSCTTVKLQAAVRRMQARKSMSDKQTKLVKIQRAMRRSLEARKAPTASSSSPQTKKKKSNNKKNGGQLTSPNKSPSRKSKRNRKSKTRLIETM